MKYLLGLFCLMIIFNHSVSAQGCKKSCATSTGCGSVSMSTTDFASAGEVLACMNNCDSGNPEFGRAKLIGSKDGAGYEIEWVTHSRTAEIGRKSTVKSIIQKSHPAAWSELIAGKAIVFGDGQFFKKGKIKSLDEKTAKIIVEWSADMTIVSGELPLKSIRIID